MEEKIKAKFRGQAVVELTIFATIIIMVLAAFLSYAQRMEQQQTIKMQAFREALLQAYKRNAGVSYTLKKDTRNFNLLAGFGQGQPSATGATVSVMWQKGFPGMQGSTDQTNFSFYKINDTSLGWETVRNPDTGANEFAGLPRVSKTLTNYDGSKQKTKVPVNIYKEDRRQSDYYDTAVTKTETNPAGTRGRIVNKSIYNLSSTIASTAYTRFDKAVADPNADANPLPDYDDTEGRYTFGSPYYADIGKDNRIVYNATNTPNKVIRGERTWTTDFSK